VVASGCLAYCLPRGLTRFAAAGDEYHRDDPRRGFNVGAAFLHIHCAGRGRPVVVLDAGLGNDGTVWRGISAETAEFSEVCVYDRAGTGYSSSGPKPRTSHEMVAELHDLLEAAQLPGPYVLVGHSLGGLNVQLYAYEHPEQVVGIVLIDSMSEDQDRRFWSLLSDEQMHGFAAGLRRGPEGIDLDGMRTSMDEVRRSKRSLHDLPIVVLTAGVQDPFPGTSPETAAQLTRVWAQMQVDLTHLSSNVVQVTAEHSRHFIQWDAPNLVVAAAREVVRAARSHSGLDASLLKRIAAETPGP